MNHMRHIDKIRESMLLIIAPDVIYMDNGIATVRHNYANKEIVFALASQVEATAYERTHDCFQVGVGLSDGFLDAAHYAVRHYIQSREHLHWREAAHIANDLSPLFAKLFGTLGAVLVKLLYPSQSASISQLY